MELIGLVRSVEARQIPGKDGGAPWTKHVAVVEVNEPLQLLEVEFSRASEVHLDKYRALVGRRALLPVYPPVTFGSRTVAKVSGAPQQLAEKSA